MRHLRREPKGIERVSCIDFLRKYVPSCKCNNGSILCRGPGRRLCIEWDE